MTKTQKAKLVKVFNLANNPRTVGEGAAAKSTLVSLCEKHSIRLADIIADADGKLDMVIDFAQGYEERAFDREFASRAAQSAGVAAERAAEFAKVNPTTARAARASRSKNGVPSRRSLIIDMINLGGFTLSAMLSSLESYGYDGRKAAKKAISGTCYDLRQNKNWFIKIDPATNTYYRVV